MICVDSSALVAIVAGEAQGIDCMRCMAVETNLVISAATLAEALIVCGRRDLEAELNELMAITPLVVIDIDAAAAHRVAAAYRDWGKGRHPARLNYGDCFAYEVAQRYACPLLYIGSDFSKTNIQSALD